MGDAPNMYHGCTSVTSVIQFISIQCLDTFLDAFQSFQEPVCDPKHVHHLWHLLESGMIHARNRGMITEQTHGTSTHKETPKPKNA
jgi:hypothetical protein